MTVTANISRILLTLTLSLTSATLWAQSVHCADSAEHVALRQKFWTACGKDDLAAIELAAKAYQEHALAERDYDSYYNTWVCKIVHQLDRMNIYQAYRVLQAMRHDLEHEHPHADEKFLVPNMLGQIYNQCGYYEGAVNKFQEAITLIKGTHYEATGLSTLYLGLAHICMVEDLEQSMHWIDMDIKEVEHHPGTPRFYRNMANAYAFKAMLQFKQERYDECRQTCQTSADYELQNHSGSTGSFIPYRKVYELVLNGHQQEALDASEKISNLKDRLLLQRDIYHYAQEPLKASRAMRRLMHMRDSITGVMISENIRNTEEDIRQIEERQQLSQRANFILALCIALLIAFVGVLTWNIRGRRRHQAALMQKNQELSIANERAKEADVAKRNFIRSVSHEIRTPLNIINGFSQVLTGEDVKLNQEERQTISKSINQSTFEITSLVNKMLALAAEDTADLQAGIRPTPIISICRQALKEVKLPDPTKVSTQLETYVSDHTIVNTNPDALCRILDFLLENAAKFTAKGHIRLICLQAGDKLQLVVEDTGCGIKPQMAAHIFERFTKGDDFKQGLGLGLAYCHETAKKLGGQLTLDTSYLQGARFVLSLPTTTVRT